MKPRSLLYALLGCLLLFGAWELLGRSGALGKTLPALSQVLSSRTDAPCRSHDAVFRSVQVTRIADRLAGERIPLMARILKRVPASGSLFAAEQGRDAALDVILERFGRWFDPQIAVSCSRWQSRIYSGKTTAPRSNAMSSANWSLDTLSEPTKIRSTGSPSLR